MAARYSKSAELSTVPGKKNASVVSLLREDSAVGGINSSLDSVVKLSSRRSGLLSNNSSVEFLGQRDLDHGLEVFLKIKIFSDASTEQFMCMVKTDSATITERSVVDIEKPAWVMITSQRLYVLSQSTEQGSTKKKQIFFCKCVILESSGYGFAVVSSHLLSSFVRVTVGLFMSWLRFDGSPQSVLCCTSAHIKTHKLLDVAREALPKV